MGRSAGATGIALSVIFAGCAHSQPRGWGQYEAACPRDAVQDVQGRCRCAPGHVLVLGACVPPSVGDSYCGPAARIEPQGCAFRRCGADELLDLASGQCTPASAIARGTACPDGTRVGLENGVPQCLSPNAQCPRGTHADAAVCARPPTCPAGSVLAGNSCRSLVSAGRQGGRQIDVGAWVALVLGADGGLGTPELCRPLLQNSDAFGPESASPMPIRIRVSLAIPDQDVSRVHAEVSASDASEAPSQAAMPAAAQSVVRQSVETLVEELRGLGGEGSAAYVKAEVRCERSTPTRPERDRHQAHAGAGVGARPR